MSPKRAGSASTPTRTSRRGWAEWPPRPATRRCNASLARYAVAVVDADRGGCDDDDGDRADSDRDPAQGRNSELLPVPRFSAGGELGEGLAAEGEADRLLIAG